MYNNMQTDRHHYQWDWIGLSSVLRPANTVYVIWETVFTGQKTQPTVSKY